MISIINPRVKEVFPRKDHTLLIVFKNGETKLYDCKPLLNFGLFQELNDLNYFLMVKVEHGTVVWPHEQDLCPAPCIWKAKKSGRNVKRLELLI